MRGKKTVRFAVSALCAAVAVAFGAGAAGAASAEAAPAAGGFVALTGDAVPRLDAALHAVAARTPALSDAVVEDDRLAYAHAFGYADLAGRRTATPETRFRIASVTKMLTAVAIMQLVESGRVALDDRLARFLPGVPHAGEVTIRELLQHTSGYWNYGDEAFNTNAVAKPTTPQAMLAAAAAHPLTSPPGTRFAYSNTGYVALGLVVEAVTHEPLARYETTHVLAPAGMTETTFAGAPRGYAGADGTPASTYSPTWLYADGDAVSTAPDVARFDVALMSGKLVRPATFEQMQQSTVDASAVAPGVRWGLGVTVYRTGGVTFVGHHGGAPGFEAEDEMIPADRFAVVVLSNAYNFPTAAANNAVLRIVAPSVVARATAEAAAAAPSPSPGAPASPAAAASEDPAVTQQLRAFYAGLLRGEVDRPKLTDQMNAALTPDVLAAMKAQLAGIGTIATLTFSGRADANGYRVYRYRATFSGGQTLPISFSLDQAGKIAGFVFS